MTDLLNYSRRLEEAGLRIVRGVIEEIVSNGLPGDHHFYLTFDTDHDGVELSDRLRASYPGEMTVVLQHQYEDLEVDEAGFAVTLSFSSVPYRLRVPWKALRRFVDPAANFGLEFHGAPRPEADTEKLGPRPVENLGANSSLAAAPAEEEEAASGPHRLAEVEAGDPPSRGTSSVAPQHSSSAPDDAAPEGDETAEEKVAEERDAEQVVRLDDFRKK